MFDTCEPNEIRPINIGTDVERFLCIIPFGIFCFINTLHVKKSLFAL
jgi:hypothetical protein